MNGQRIRTVELQLLRQGPPHNQLLSPLTDYLALCGDHPNTTLNFPLEHQSLKVRLHALRYKDSEETRKIQLFETASVVAGMFADVPGLISELGHRDSIAESLVHLSIATTASELSLVPFELAHSPPGFPGSGGSLSLQTEFPVCITRRSRKVRFDSLDWNVTPRILMVASDAGGDIPLTSHYTLLRELIDPWVFKDVRKPESVDETSPDQVLPHVRKRLVLLKDANIRSIRDTIYQAIDENQPFTHIHVLAHGCPLPNQDESYGVALHHPNQSGVDAVDGVRLGQLFTGKLADDRQRRRLNTDTVRPNVVTLAICDSGNTGFDVARPGASVAFHIHEAGIPMVVGSQFQLTKGGSVVLTNSIYRQLLEGCDPRICLWEARRDLLSQCAERLKVNSEGRHDWASIVVFAAFPLNIERESKKLERSQQKMRMDLKLISGDRLMEQIRINPQVKSQKDAWTEYVKTHANDIKNEVRRFDAFVDEQRSQSNEYIDLLGISASANKRAAEVLWTKQFLGHKRDDANDTAAKPGADKGSDGNSVIDDWLKFIWQSYRRYLNVTERDTNQDWAFVQTLFLQRFISFYKGAPKYMRLTKQDDDTKKQAVDNTERSLYSDWFRAYYICSMQRFPARIEPQQQVWQLTNWLELGLLRTLIGRFSYRSEKGVRFRLKNEYGIEKMLEWLRSMDRLSNISDHDTNFAVYAGRRQLLRYRQFATMLFIGEDTSGASRKQSAIRDSGGYERLAKEYAEFGEMYPVIESHILDQIDIQPDEWGSSED